MHRSSKYLDVYNMIKADILSEVYQPGSFLPTEKELMEKYRASRTTIRHAMEILRNEQVVSIKQGRGTQLILRDKSQQDDFTLFHNVASVTNSFLLTEESRVNTQGCIIGITQPPPEVAQALQIDEASSVYRLERLYFVNGIPFSWQANYLTSESLPGFERFSGQIDALHNLYRFLDSQYHIQFSSGPETISAIPAGFFDAKLLEVEAGTPLMVFVRTAVFSDGTQEYTKLFTRPDLIKITISMAGPPDGKVV